MIIEGVPRIDEWADRDGKNRYTFEVQATDMQFVQARQEVTGEEYYQEPTKRNNPKEDDSDIPF